MNRLVVRYGRHHSQIGELWHPGQADGPLPVVVLIHGGFWRAVYTKRLMRRLAAAVTHARVAAWNIEYRRTGALGGGGGWPATFEDVAAAVDHLAHIPGVDLDRVVTCGHSAGGHLALWAAARGRLPEGAPGAAPVVKLRGAVSLAGVVDLVEAAAAGLGAGAVQALLGGEPDEVAERYALASPAALLPFGVPQVLVHGLDDTTVPPGSSERYQRAAEAAGDTVTYLPQAGADHMAMIKPTSPAWPAVAAELQRLLA
jgi:acetyl esterase/lipase